MGITTSCCSVVIQAGELSTLEWLNGDNGSGNYDVVSGSNTCNKEASTIHSGIYTISGYSETIDSRYSRDGIGYYYTNIGPSPVWVSYLNRYRDGLLIHPCRSHGTDGCIGLVWPKYEILDFQDKLICYQNKTIRLYVFINEK